jgi:hypothetical protein
MRIEQARTEHFTHLIVEDIEKFMNDGFSDEIPRRKFDAVRFKMMISAVLSDLNSVAFLLFDDQNRCQGIFMGVIAPDIVTSEMLGTQLVWRVSKQGKGYGMGLLCFFAKWCEKNGATQVVVAGGHGEERKKRLAIKLRLLGFEPVTSMWMRGI